LFLSNDFFPFFSLAAMSNSSSQNSLGEMAICDGARLLVLFSSLYPSSIASLIPDAVCLNRGSSHIFFFLFFIEFSFD